MYRRLLMISAVIVIATLCSAIQPLPVKATFSGANGRIAYDTFDDFGDGHFEIHTVNPDGSDDSNLTNNPAPDRMPAWSPNGEKLLFVRDGLYTMNPDGSDQTKLLGPDGLGFGGSNPAWSPDGTKIAFMEGTLIPETFEFNRDIYVANLDGTGKTRLTFDLGEDDNPDWSPDGTKIVFDRVGAGDDSGLYTMNADGSDQTLILDESSGVSGQFGNWSPDGNKIAIFGFDFIDEVQVDIFVINPDGTGLTKLTDDPFFEFHPTWSPDGTKIAFTKSEPSGAFSDEIFVMNADGSDQVRVTTDGFRKFNLSWQSIQAGQTPQQAITDLQETAKSLGVSHGSLKKASDLLSDDNPNNDKGACGKLKAFVNHVKAQAGKKLTEGQADSLIDKARDIREQLDC